MPRIRIAVVGVGNCASSLLQGIALYRDLFKGGIPEKVPGLMHPEIGGFAPGEIETVLAVDIDRRKVGRPVGEALFAEPNCAMRLYPAVDKGVTVEMGNPLDGLSAHMNDYPESRRFVLAGQKPLELAQLVRRLRETKTEILLNYLPVGSEMATAFYAEACLEAGVSLVNCMPVFVASNPVWAERFRTKGIPLIGDDIKSQLGATIVHRVLTKLFVDRGVKLDRTYQLNTGGNTDFLNMLNRDRLKSKKISKTEAVQSQLPERLPDEDIHIGPSDYVPWQKDNKLCFVRMEGRGFSGAPVSIELRLSVEDSPNSAGIVIDAIRCLKIARQRGLRGPLEGVSAYYMKHPPRQMDDAQARLETERFLQGEAEEVTLLPSADEGRARVPAHLST
ncbi:MAG: inositol-3-phosphate synthase [Candidatus Omnitrophica bacterium]|nr:inositol-3-phosphate synthase [Candidatus Omnitrophota bacterium]